MMAEEMHDLGVQGGLSAAGVVYLVKAVANPPGLMLVVETVGVGFLAPDRILHWAGSRLFRLLKVMQPSTHPMQDVCCWLPSSSSSS
jgi:hypothetical protein